MVSVDTDTSTHIQDKTEFQIYDVAAVNISEICTYLGVHDQVNMKSVCKWWRINLSETFLSILVDMDYSRMLDHSDDFLEQMLSIFIQKNTKILVLRNILAWGKEFGIVARVVKEKHADLVQLTLRDCKVRREFATAAHYWTHPKRIPPCLWLSLMFVTKKLVLENYTMRDPLGAALNYFDSEMPHVIPSDSERRHGRRKKLPIVLARCEFDCTKPLKQHYYSFIMALNSNCPAVRPENRMEVMLLYNFWIHSDADENQWLSLGNVIKCLNEGVPVTRKNLDVNVSALKHLDPLTLNKLTVHALHRLYCHNLTVSDSLSAIRDSWLVLQTLDQRTMHRVASETISIKEQRGNVRIHDRVLPASLSELRGSQIESQERT